MHDGIEGDADKNADNPTLPSPTANTSHDTSPSANASQSATGMDATVNEKDKWSTIHHQILWGGNETVCISKEEIQNIIGKCQGSPTDAERQE